MYQIKLLGKNFVLIVALSNTYEVDEKENKLNSVTNANKENEDLKIGTGRKGIMFKVVGACKRQQELDVEHIKYEMK